MTISCDYASPDNHDNVNYHFDADSMTVVPATDTLVTAFVDGGGTIADYITPASPSPAAPHLNSGMLIRFSATNPIMVYENLGVSGVTRRAKGFDRVFHVTPMPTDQYCVLVSVLDPAVRNVRVVARTVDYVDIKITDQLGAAQDAAEVTMKIERVLTPS